MGVGCGGPGEDLEDLWEYLKREIIWGIWELDVEWGALLFLCLLSIFHLLLPFLLSLFMLSSTVLSTSMGFNYHPLG